MSEKSCETCKHYHTPEDVRLSPFCDLYWTYIPRYGGSGCAYEPINKEEGDGDTE